MNNRVESRHQPDSPGSSSHPGSFDWGSGEHAVERAGRALDVVAVVAQESGLSPHCALDLESADAALSESERVLNSQLGDSGRSGTVEASALAAALIQVKTVRTEIRDAELARRSAALKDVRAALSRLRLVRSSQDLVQQAPVEIGRLGYHRGMVSFISGSRWLTRSAFTPNDPGLAESLVDVGNASPGMIGRDLPETELVRDQTPVLVNDAQNHPRVHRELLTLAKTRAYVAAPLATHSKVVGMVHADREGEPGTISDFDRDLLGMFAEGLGFAFEHTVLLEQLDTLRSSLEDQARSVTDLIDGFVGPDGANWESPTEASPVVPICSLDGPLACLTRRELEVLQHLAAGKSNTQIASQLFVCAGTVKTHVKHVLRKLGAANRAEAVSRYHTVVTGPSR